MNRKTGAKFGIIFSVSIAFLITLITVTSNSSKKKDVTTTTKTNTEEPILIKNVPQTSSQFQIGIKKVSKKKYI